MYFRSMRKLQGDVSLSEPIDVDGDGNSLELMDVISQEDDLVERVSLSESCRALREAVETVLTEREAKIVRMRYGLDNEKPLTQREVADACGISRSYVSRRN